MDSLPDDSSIAHRRQLVREAVLAQSRTIQSPNFLRAATTDLRMLFLLYDEHFFQREFKLLLQQAGAPCALAFSGRLRSSGGMTKRRRARRGGAVEYEILLSSTLLFSNFKNGEGATLVGLHCADRLDGLMRIFEHELLHLLEFLRYGKSKCSAKRFQQMSRAFFGHTAHQHRMVTQRQRTLASTTLRPGAPVRFKVEGQALTGVLNTIHKRATVLVEHKHGRRYTDGKKYVKYYVPVGLLERVEAI